LPVDDDFRFESLRRGYAHDSPVGYAATQLTICRKIRSLAAEGKFIEACGQAFHVDQIVREEEIKYTTTADGPSRGGKAATRPEGRQAGRQTEIDIDGHIAVFKGGSLEAAIRACAAQKKAALEPWAAHVEGLVTGRRGEVVPIRSKR